MVLNYRSVGNGNVSPTRAFTIFFIVKYTV